MVKCQGRYFRPSSERFVNQERKVVESLNLMQAFSRTLLTGYAILRSKVGSSRSLGDTKLAREMVRPLRKIITSH